MNHTEKQIRFFEKIISHTELVLPHIKKISSQEYKTEMRMIAEDVCISATRIIHCLKNSDSRMFKEAEREECYFFSCLSRFKELCECMETKTELKLNERREKELKEKRTINLKDVPDYCSPHIDSNRAH